MGERKTSEAQIRAVKAWDERNNITYQSVKIKKELQDAFKATCAKNGAKVNTVLREFMEDYVKRGGRV